jgi:YesN/AraC family two-component response regulator
MVTEKERRCYAKEIIRRIFNTNSLHVGTKGESAVYKALVVDDEKNIRERLTASFPWNEAGFEVIGSARDGLEALNIVEKNTPDVVLTDILMPEMSGLELAQVLQARYPHIKVLILSAYDEFKYAQEAVRLGIKGYLLKPLMKDEFLAVMTGMANALGKESEMRSARLQDLPDPREEFMLIDLIKGENVRQYTDAWLQDYMRLIVCSFGKGFENDLGLSIRQMLTQEAMGFWRDNRVPTLFYGNDLVMFFHERRPISKYDLKGKLESFSDFLGTFMKTVFEKNCTLSIGVGNLIKNPENIRISYNQAVYALGYQYFDASRSILFYQDLSASEPGEAGTDEAAQLSAAMDRLVESILARHADEHVVRLQEFLDTLEQGKRGKIGEIRVAISEFILSLLLKAKERGLRVPGLVKTQAIGQIYAAETLADLKKWLRQTVASMTEVPIPAEEREGNRYVQLAKQHVQNHYSQKITLEDMANKLFLHPAYFSTVFKKETGQNFIDYVNGVRVRKAMELLRNEDRKIKDICVQVGFPNHSYFNKVFKKLIGVKPHTFRANRKNGS